jgi:hypothetical protein
VMKFITKHPHLTWMFILLTTCLIFGPGRVGGWIHVNTIRLVYGVWHFLSALVGA